jgi:alginate O-acetyltransferase complex protein AlgI
MIFSTPAFLFLFLPPLLLISFFLRRRAQNLLLLLASLLFYAWGEGWLVLLLLGSALGNHFIGLAIENSPAPGKRKAILVSGLGLNLVLLIVFKYADFFLSNLEPLLRGTGLAVGRGLHWHQPLGISFFTFMAMAYLSEVHQRAIPAERNFLHTALFISFFPTVLAGPIHRYSRLRRQLSERQTTPELLSRGIRRFIIGLGKKVLLADILGRAVDAIFAIPNPELTAALAWLGGAGYTLQIFLDFSGYSDMAIGLGSMFGFTFMENFNYPYISRSITEFWTRWHISLSTWLRDFLFLPMAYAISRRIRGDRLLGIRVDSWCYYPAMLLTMLLCGLWHGAAWTFVAWGLYHGLFIMLERQALKKRLKRLWAPLQLAYAILVVSFGWVLFRAADFAQASAFWRAMLGFGGGSGKEFYPALYLDNVTLLALAVAILLATPVGRALPAVATRLIQGAGARSRGWMSAGFQLITAILLTAVLLASAMRLAISTYKPFIYFRF